MNQQPAIDREVRDRVRRIETRLTKIGRHMGVDVGGGQPEWNAAEGRVDIPTPNCNIGDIVKAVPTNVGHLDRIDVYVGNEYLCSLAIDR